MYYEIADEMMLGLLSSLFGFYTTLVTGFSGCALTEQTQRDPDGFVIQWTEYSPMQTVLDNNTESATIVMLPPTGGVTPIDQRFATKLCQRKQRVLLVKTWTAIT